MRSHSKLIEVDAYVDVSASEAITLVSAIFCTLGCDSKTAGIVAAHLADSNLCGVESHGIMRTLQYAEQFESDHMNAAATPQVIESPRGTLEVDGNGGIGIPAMGLAFEQAMTLASKQGISAIAVRNAGHTGRHGAFADTAAEAGFLTILTGGGNRLVWRQVAPHGGGRARLPTNPYCIGIPGGERGPVVLDFATAKIAGGWIYAAKSAGARLPENCILDRHGNPSQDPDAYFDGGAILPSGEHKGYALALIAELIGEAMLGPVTREGNWLLIAIDTTAWRVAGEIQQVAEEILDDLRNCPPAPGFSRVEIPGERERAHRASSAGMLSIPENTWKQLLQLGNRLGV